ncbi:MAG: hypothetical protein N2511_08275, partial [Thermodesulfovibrionales bacterium]|nr:hypothetical protein [Thermodesulfovibrionales bacterium]
MKKWNLKIYNKYTHPFLSWFYSELICSWGLFAFFLAGLWYEISNGFINMAIPFIFFLCLSALLVGLFQHSIDVLLFSPAVVWVTRDGIYGKNMLERYFFYFSKPHLLAKWEEIEKLVWKMYPLCLNDNVGYVVFYKNNGKKFRISYHGFNPSRITIFDEKKILWNETDKGLCTELFGIIGWKIGLDKFHNFFEEELRAISGVRKRTMSIEGFRRVI